MFSSHTINLLIWDAGIEVTEEQGDYYDPLFTYREGDEASYFIFDELEGHEGDVGLSDAGEGREIPMASSPGGLVAEPVASATVEEESSAIIITEAIKTDEHLSELASGELAVSGASPVVVTTGVPATKPVIVSTTIKKAFKDITEGIIKSPTSFGNVIVACKQPSFFLLIFDLTKIFS